VEAISRVRDEFGVDRYHSSFSHDNNIAEFGVDRYHSSFSHDNNIAEFYHIPVNALDSNRVELERLHVFNNLLYFALYGNESNPHGKLQIKQCFELAGKPIPSETELKQLSEKQSQQILEGVVPSTLLNDLIYSSRNQAGQA